jgi:peptidyl-prolyl cis-trans isomerase B (cyclophilin B)
MITTIAIAVSLASAPSAGALVAREGPAVQWNAPGSYVDGSAYKVQIEVEGPAGGTVISSWLFTPSAFSVDGKQLAKREERGSIELPAGFKVTGSIDLAPYLEDVRGDFKLEFASGMAVGEPLQVSYFERADTGVKFLELPPEALSAYHVLIETNRGSMLARFWPDVAPNHVRNFLDLAASKFYDGLTFHRVIPGFMIQGGDPTGTGSGNGPRTLQAEFSTTKQHVPGVLSMARTNDPNSASCQFFICHAKAPHLDGSYTAFGELVWGFDVVDKIANAPLGARERPRDPQKVERMLVLKKPGPAAAEAGGESPQK